MSQLIGMSSHKITNTSTSWWKSKKHRNINEFSFLLLQSDKDEIEIISRFYSIPLDVENIIRAFVKHKYLNYDYIQRKYLWEDSSILIMDVSSRIMWNLLICYIHTANTCSSIIETMKTAFSQNP